MSDKYAPDEPEGSRFRGNQYISKKDILVIGVVLVLLVALFLPVFQKMKRDANKKICSDNIQDISKAMFLYSTQHDDRFPPLYVMGKDELPMMLNGATWTWATDIEPHTSNGKFGCPAATPEEHCSMYSQETRLPKPLAYGMYAGMASQPVALIDSDSTTALISETSNNGRGDTYNPVPMVGSNGSVFSNNGFLIGWDNKPNGNRQFSMDTQFVTRLAFSGTANGDFFSKEVKPRHEVGLHMIYADGHMGIISAEDARVQHLPPQLTGLWNTD